MDFEHGPLTPRELAGALNAWANHCPTFQPNLVIGSEPHTGMSFVINQVTRVLGEAHGNQPRTDDTVRADDVRNPNEEDDIPELVDGVE